MGVVALIAAINTLTAIGMSNIDHYENQLTDYANMKLRSIPGITLYSQTAQGEPRIGVIPFNIKGIAHEKVATILSNQAGIAVRTGCFCAQPYIQKLLAVSSKQMEFYQKNVDAARPGVVRISFGLYNDFAEIDTLAHWLERIIKHPTSYT